MPVGKWRGKAFLDSMWPTVRSNKTCSLPMLNSCTWLSQPISVIWTAFCRHILSLQSQRIESEVMCEPNRITVRHGRLSEPRTITGSKKLESVELIHASNTVSSKFPLTCHKTISELNSTVSAHFSAGLAKFWGFWDIYIYINFQYIRLLYIYIYILSTYI